MYWKGKKQRVSPRFKSALEAIVENRIERKEGELVELREMQEELRGTGKLEDTKAWGLLDKLWR